MEFNSNDENSEIIGDKKKTNSNLEKIMKMNYNYISCIDSRRKPDIYIGGKINLPAKNYRFTDIVKKEADKKISGENQKAKIDIDYVYKDKELDGLSHKVTDSIKKSKIYLNEETEEATKKVDLTKLEEIEEKKEFQENIEELRKKGKSYDSDADVDGISSSFK